MSSQSTEIFTDIAQAVRLQEGPVGVRAIVRAFRQIGPAATRDISRHTGLPVPIVAAVGNELRRKGLLSERRPSQLTESGLALIAELGASLDLDVDCSRCSGLEIPIPRALQEAVEQLRRISATGPGADLALDQSHCTAETKVRRVLALIRAGVLPGSSVLLIGDDDQVSIALAVVGAALGIPLVSHLTVVDISPDVLDFISDTASTLDFRVELIQHDLRNPLPKRIIGQSDAAMTDPPYTAEGARLFLSRAIEGLKPGPAQSIFFSFGAKGPDEMLEVQREILNLNLVTHSLIRNFNEYEGSGILGGTGFFQHLLTTELTTSTVPEPYQGLLYTREKRSRLREYECGSCGALFAVGAGAQWNSVADLRAAGCPKCGKGPFRPRQLIGEA